MRTAVISSPRRGRAWTSLLTRTVDSFFLGPACQQTDHRRDAVQRNHRLCGENPQRAGIYFILEGQLGQRHPVLPYPSPQLCF